MAVRVGINGFGRMGRLALRAAFGHPQIEIVHINELKGTPETAEHLLEFHNVHGRWRVSIGAGVDSLTVEDRRIAYSAFSKPAEVPWEDAGIELVLECSGKFVTPESLQPYFECGVRKVVVAAPSKKTPST